MMTHFRLSKQHTYYYYIFYRSVLLAAVTREARSDQLQCYSSPVMSQCTFRRKALEATAKSFPSSEFNPDNRSALPVARLAHPRRGSPRKQEKSGPRTTRTSANARLSALLLCGQTRPTCDWQRLKQRRVTNAAADDLLYQFKGRRPLPKRTNNVWRRFSRWP